MIKVINNEYLLIIIILIEYNLPCQSDAFGFDSDFCYKTSEYRMTFEMAKEFCSDYDLPLLKITSKEEASKLIDAFARASYEEEIDELQDYWIGLTRSIGRDGQCYFIFKKLQNIKIYDFMYQDTFFVNDN